jgi:pilus assembly protein CpaC
VGNQSHSVRVSFSNQKQFQIEIKKALSEMRGLSLSSDNKDIEIHGTLLRFSDWVQIAGIAREYQGEYSFRAQALPDVAEEAMNYLNDVVLKKGFPVIRFSARPQFTALLPRASSNLKALAESTLGPFGILVKMSDSNLALQPLIRTRVILAEISKSYSQDFGVSWPSEFQAQVLPKPSLGNDLMATLHALEAHGQAQVLASPNLLCRSGAEAKFLAGGEFPIRMISRLTHDVVWKSHGVILNVKPRADFNGAISLEIETEVSLLDMAHAVDGIPAIKKSSVKSHFDLPGRRTIALSGLLRQELGDSREGLPLLSQIPILGSLFSSRKFLNQKSELVIFVTPEIFSPESSEPIQMPEGWTNEGF